MINNENKPNSSKGYEIDWMFKLFDNEEKDQHHIKHKITFEEAKYRPEFWRVTFFTLLRMILGVGTVYLTFKSDVSQLDIPALLTIAAWLTDYFDGAYARKHGVCTNVGKMLDRGFADSAMIINTIAIPILLITK